jgi:hypothetical protein
MNPQDFLRNAVNKISRGRPVPGSLKAEIQALSQYNPLIPMENTAFLVAKTSPILNLNQQLIKESLLPLQADSAANEYLRFVVKTAVQQAAATNRPVENVVQDIIHNTNVKGYMGNAPQGAGALTQVTQVINEPYFQTLIDPESPLGFSQTEALIGYHRN